MERYIAIGMAVFGVALFAAWPRPPDPKPTQRLGYLTVVDPGSAVTWRWHSPKGVEHLGGNRYQVTGTVGNARTATSFAVRLLCDENRTIAAIKIGDTPTKPGGEITNMQTALGDMHRLTCDWRDHS